MRNSSRKSRSDDFVGLLTVLSVIGSVFVGLKMGNWVMGFLFLALCLFLMVAASIIYWYLKSQRLLASGIHEVDRMSGVAFERFLLAHFKNAGYSADLTSSGNDFGADLVLKKDGRKVVVQAKRWNSSVGVEAVQQVVASINYYRADGGMVVTNSSFTEQARELARLNNIELWDRETLIRIMSETNSKGLAGTVVSKNDGGLPEKACPRCGSPLVVRSGKRGQFVGCSSFPKCRFTRDI